MSVSVSKADGVTVFTLTADPESSWPPVCQILKNLCYSPVCCSVSSQLRRLQGASQSVLGALQIMVGLLNIGLGTLLLDTTYAWNIEYSGYSYWLGALYILFGIMCILSEKYPSPCLVMMNTTLNLIGIAFAIVGVVFYSIAAAEMRLWWDCDGNSDYRYYSWRYHTTTPSPSADRDIAIQRCEEAKATVMMLLRGMYGLLIVLSALELCVVISATVLGIKSLKRRVKERNQSAGDPELCKPLLEEDLTKPAA